MLRLHPAGSGRRRGTAVGWMLLAACAASDLPSAWGQIFVDQTATGAGNGSSWTDAFTTLQDALVSGLPPAQIWVAAGIYRPDLGGGQLPGDRQASFILASGTQVYGGFSGMETSIAQRDPVANPTMLSADLLANDGPGFANNSDNSFHVVLVDDGAAPVILDGFIVRGGNANGPGAMDSGGGLVNAATPLQVRNCTFQSNFAMARGGAIHVLNGQTVIDSCHFIANMANEGGAAACQFSSLALRDCAFSMNMTFPGGPGGGGGVAGLSSDLQVANCSFTQNQSSFGGALSASGGSLALWQSSVQFNSAGQLGGGLHVSNAGVMLIDSLLSINDAVFGGAAAFLNSSPSSHLVNCTIAGNTTSGQGGGLLIAGANPQIENCILWGNQDNSGSGAQAQVSGGSPVVTFSVVQGGWSGPGMANVATDPLFVDAGGPDLHLLPGSPAIDAGNSQALPQDTLDLDGDLDTAEPLPVDLGGGPRLVDDSSTPNTGVPDLTGVVVDMGCYEAADAGPADCNGNGVPDSQDISLGDSTDCNSNQIPDECELADCPPALPACDDCNNNLLPDECDIFGGTSLDLDGNGIPDECVEFTGGCGPVDPDWSCTGNWNLDGLFPNNGTATYSVTLDQLDLCVLDLNITIDTLRIIEGAALRVVQAGQGNLAVVQPAGALLESDLLVAHDRLIDVDAGPVVLRGSGLYSRDSLAAPGSVTARLTAASILVEPGGAVQLSDSMSLTVGGDYVLDGTSLDPPCPGCGGKTPPATGGGDDSEVLIEGDLVMSGSVFWTYTSAMFLELHGDFVNHSTTPGIFDFAHGSLLLNGPASQVFEVGGEDLGTTLDGFDHPTQMHSNFSVGTIDIEDDGPGPATNVIFENSFANIIGNGPCDEALYVHTLILRSGSTILIDDCRVYYETLIDEGGTVSTAGCGQLLELPGCADDDDCDDGDICFGDTCVDGTCTYTPTLAGCADLDDNLVRDDNCVWWSCSRGMCDPTVVVFADMGGAYGACPPDGAADANDRYHALNCFSDMNTLGASGYPCEYSPPTAFNVDAGGQFGDCQPDGVCDGHDAFHALNAFAGTTNCSCSGPAPGGRAHPAANPHRPAGHKEPQVLAAAGLRLAARADSIRPGDAVDVDVFLKDGLADLRGYQLQFATGGGRSGALEVTDLASVPRADAAFAGLDPWQAYNVPGARLLLGLDQAGVAVAPGSYLATITLRAGPTARGTFTVELLPESEGGRTFLFPTPARGKIQISELAPARITVTPGPEPALRPR